jgi:hypothetical protein
MIDSGTPRPYEHWAESSIDRPEDAAYTFGFHLMKQCRSEALRACEFPKVPTTVEEFRTHIASAVDTALHNMMAMLEGYWRLQAGANHSVEYALSVCVKDDSGSIVERIDISQCLLDLPIGYWKWKDGEFH